MLARFVPGIRVDIAQIVDRHPIVNADSMVQEQLPHRLEARRK